MTRIRDIVYNGLFFGVCVLLNRLFEDIFMFLPYVDCISHLRRERLGQSVTEPLSNYVYTLHTGALRGGQNRSLSHVFQKQLYCVGSVF